MQGSWEHSFHIASNGQNRLLLNTFREEKCLSDYIGHRVIGVVYNTEHEKYGNYVPLILPKRYDAFIHATTTLHPLHIQPEGSQIAETYRF